MIALREPSLGPVMGIKGGATGGGRAQVLPMEEHQSSFYRGHARNHCSRIMHYRQVGGQSYPTRK